MVEGSPADGTLADRRSGALPPAPEYKVFVGGISWHMDDKELKHTFKDYHAIDARVMLDRQTQRSRGFGFVHFANKEDMEDAAAALHGTEVDGRKISVTRAIPQSDTLPGTPAAALARGPGRNDRHHKRGHGSYDRGYERRMDRGGGGSYDRGYDRGGYDRGYGRGDHERGGGYERGYDRGAYARPSAYDRATEYERPPRGAYEGGYGRGYSDYGRSYDRGGGGARDPHDADYDLPPSNGADTRGGSHGPGGYWSKGDGGYPAERPSRGRPPQAYYEDDYDYAPRREDYLPAASGRHAGARSGPYGRPAGGFPR